MTALNKYFDKKIDRVKKELSYKLEIVLQATAELRVRPEQLSQANNPKGETSTEGIRRTLESCIILVII